MTRISIPWKTYLHYKKKLNHQDVALYEAILNGLLEWERRIAIPAANDATHVYDVFMMILRDIPMLFHVSNGLKISMGFNSYVMPDYIMDQQTYSQYSSSVEKFLKNCRELIMEYKTFNKLQIMHDSIVKHVEYHDTQTNNEHNILGTILEKRAVCESIAKSYKLLCDYNMIPSIVVFGYSNANNQSVRRTSCSSSSSTSEDNHAWNIVQLDGLWYNLDLTFDVTLGNFGALTAFRYDYFLRSDQIFNLEHHASQIDLLPKCPNDFNLYRKIDQYIQTKADVSSVVKVALKTKSNVKTIVFGVDPSSGVEEKEIASAVNKTCFFSGRKASSYTYNEKTGVFCVVLE